MIKTSEVLILKRGIMHLHFSRRKVLIVFISSVSDLSSLNSKSYLRLTETELY